MEILFLDLSKRIRFINNNLVLLRMGKEEKKSPKKSKKEWQEINFVLAYDRINMFIKLLKNKKFVNVIVPLFFIFILMWYSYSLRSGPINLNFLDDQVKSNTYIMIKSILKQEIDAQYPNLNDLYKNQLVEERFREILKNGYFNYGNKTYYINDLINSNIKIIKDKFQIDGQTYLTAIDPYMYLRYSTNMLDHGYPGETKKVNPATHKLENFDTLRLAPEGSFIGERPNMHTYLEYLLYKLHRLDKNASLADRIRAIFLLPVIIVLLSVIPAYFIIRKFSNDLSAFIGSLILFSGSVFISRTTAGFVDTDAYNIFFPLLVVLLILYSFSTKNAKKGLLMGSLAGFVQVAYLWAWSAGWFIFIFIIGSIIAYLGYLLLSWILRNKSSISINRLLNYLNVPLVSSIGFILTSEFLSYIIYGNDIITMSIRGILGGLSNIASVSRSNIWPNVYSTVAELNPASLSSIFNSVGGKFVITIALLGTFMPIYNRLKRSNLKKVYFASSLLWYLSMILWYAFASLSANNKFLYIILLFLPNIIGILWLIVIGEAVEEDIFLSFITMSWIAGTIFMALNGVRFILLLTPAVGISFGLGFYYLTKSLDKSLKELFENKNAKYLGTITMILVFVLIFYPIASKAKYIGNQTPNMTDGWYDTLVKIRNESPENAIISSWWDFGHEFAAIAHRGVTFDGASQTKPQSHWIGKVLLENDDQLVLGILRMLVCSGNKAFEYTNSIVKSESGGVNIVEDLIYKILPYNLTNEERMNIIMHYPYYNFTREEAENITNLVACDNPPEDFFITSQDMVGKSGVWAHWGLWNFTKKFVYDNYKRKSPEEIAQIIHRNDSRISELVEELKKIDAKSKIEGVRYEDLVNQWLAPYPSYIPLNKKYLYDCVVKDKLVICANGFSINLSSLKVIPPATIKDNFKPRRLIFPTYNNSIIVKSFGDESDVDVVLIPITPSKYKILLAMYPLGDSLFTRLFYLDGYGVTGFKKFHDVTTVVGQRVITWKVDWKNITFSNSSNTIRYIN